MKFLRHSSNPIIARKADTFYSKHAANPDLLLFRGQYHLYFRGQFQAGHDQIGVAYASQQAFNGVHWQLSLENSIIRVSDDSAEFDSGHILDPAAIILNERVYLYYTAHRSDWNYWNIPSFIGLAISADGTHFEKSSNNPIIFGTAPEVVAHDGRIYLFLQRKTASNFFEIYCCQSDDGLHFPESQQQVVLRPSGVPGTFDFFSISTVRIWREEPWFYMTYGGCDRYFDYPRAIGLARSPDLLHWERYPGNPILTRGDAGAWDEGALWFATVNKINQTYYLWYEGAGSGLGSGSAEARKLSQQCRGQDYGGYAESSFS